MPARDRDALRARPGRTRRAATPRPPSTESTTRCGGSPAPRPSPPSRPKARWARISAANDALDAAADAQQTANLIDERLKTIEHDLARLDEDKDACVAELERLLGTTLHIVRRMLRDGRIPDHVPRFGGEPVFKMNTDLVASPRRTAKGDPSKLRERPRRSQPGPGNRPGHRRRTRRSNARCARKGGRSGSELLKPKGEGNTEHMPIDRVTVSGGELLTAAMMIYVVVARLRAEAMPGSTGEPGVLILDNPLGKANKALLLKTQIGLADAMGIQLFYTTGIQDYAALAEFENIVKLRRNRQSQSTGRIHVELEPIRVHIDREPTGTRHAHIRRRIELSPFEQELRRLGKRRIRLAELRDAYFRAHREALDAPDSRRLLHDALRDLKDDGAVELPARGWDESGSPPLPRTVLLRNAGRKGTTRAAQAWLPTLAFAADERNRGPADNSRGNQRLPHRQAGREASISCRHESGHCTSSGTRSASTICGKARPRCSRGASPCAISVATRSPHRCRSKRIRDGHAVVRSWSSRTTTRTRVSRCWNHKARQYAAIAYGGGNAFRQGAGNLDEIITRTKASGTVYVGDLDPAGAAILLGVNDHRQSTGRSAICPHRGLYRWLLANGCRRPLKKTPAADMLTKLGGLFPFELVRGLLDLWKTGQRIPQESFGLEQLSGTDERIARADTA